MQKPFDTHPEEKSLHELLDGVLPLGERAGLESHLAICPACAARLATLQTLFEALGQLPDLPIERDLAPGVLAALSAPRRRAPHIGGLMVLQAATLALIASLLWPRLGAQATIGLNWLLRSPLAEAWRNTLVTVREMLVGAAQLFQAQGLPGAGALRLPRVASPGTLEAWALVAGILFLWLVANGILLRNGRAHIAR